MIISFLRDEIGIPRLCIENAPLEPVAFFKVLRVKLNNKLKCEDNTVARVKKTSRRLHTIRVLRRCGLPVCDFLTVYFALVRSILKYASPVCHTTLPLYLSDNIEKVQKRAFCIIYPDVHHTDALIIAQCKLLVDRSHDICGQTFKKIQDPAC